MCESSGSTWGESAHPSGLQFYLLSLLPVVKKAAAQLGEDAAEEGHIGPQLLGECVQAGEGPEIHHAIGGLGAVLNRDISGCQDHVQLCDRYGGLNI